MERPSGDNESQRAAVLDAEQCYDVEHIPDGDDVQRHIFYPQSFRAHGNGPPGDEIVGGFVFAQQNGRRADSVIWTKYCRSAAETCELGFRKAERDNARVLEAGRELKEPKVYRGYIQANAGNVRTVIPDLFRVVHMPGEGIHHAEVEMDDQFIQLVNSNLEPEERTKIRGGVLGKKDAMIHAIFRLMQTFGPLTPPIASATPERKQSE
jgi:hypothetical protein